MSEGHAVAGLANTLRRRNAYILELIGRVVSSIAVREFWVCDDLNSRRALIYQKQCNGVFIGQPCLEPEEVGKIYFSICSSVQAANIHSCGSEKHHDKAFVTRPSCSQIATCDSIASSRPP